MDIDGDGNTNLILIGAPHYYEQTRGGQVSVCPLPRGVSDGWMGQMWLGVRWRIAMVLGLSLFLLSRGLHGGVKPFSTGSRAIPGVALGQL